MASDLTIPGVRPAHNYVLHGHMPPEGRSWRYTRERIAELEAEGRVLQRRSGRPVLKRYFAEVAAADQGGVPSPEQAPLPLAVPFIVRQFSQALARVLATQPAELARVEWRDLERLLGEVCEGLGFRTRVTRAGRDGGFDLELSAEDLDYLIEVKHWTAPNRAGRPQLMRFGEVVVREGVARGMLLSTSGFRRVVLAERVEFTPDRIALADGRKVIGLCQHYVAASNGVWRPATSLADVLFEDTF
jgi:hypothetical protein